MPLTLLPHLPRHLAGRVHHLCFDSVLEHSTAGLLEFSPEAWQVSIHGLT